MIELSVVIPSYRRVDLLAACLRSVLRHRPAACEVIVVDDGSDDASVSRTAAQFPGVRVVRLEQRGGFCLAANAGIAAARGKITQLLNDDTEVCAGWAQAAMARFADETIVAVAPLVLQWPEGNIIDSAGDGYFVGGLAYKRGHGQALHKRYLQPCDVFGASASSAFYRRDRLIEVGAFPADFGAYFEDVDLSFRLRRGGRRIVYEPAARVLHHVSASHGRRPDAALLRQQSRNEEHVFWRNVTKAALPLHVAVLLGKAARRWREGTLTPFLQGRLDALRELTGPSDA